MSADERKLPVKLVTICGREIRPPTDLLVYTHHKPSALTDEGFRKAMGLPPAEGTLRVYSVRLDRVLDGEQTYDIQRVEEGDVLVLTDVSDVEQVKLLAQRYHPAAQKDRAGALVQRLKKHPLAAVLIAVSAFLIGLANFTDALEKLVKYFFG